MSMNMNNNRLVHKTIKKKCFIRMPLANETSALESRNIKHFRNNFTK
jgi:hypothetical protein